MGGLALWVAMVAIIAGLLLFHVDTAQKPVPAAMIHPLMSPFATSFSWAENLPAIATEKKNIDPTPAAALGSKQKEVLFHPIIQEVAHRHQVDPDLVSAIIMVESSFRPKATSHKGAKGLMQLMPLTAEELGVEDIYNPKDNINAGVKYFRQLLNRFEGDVELALAAYNAGSRKVRQHNGVPPFKATQYYIEKVFEHYRYYKEKRFSEGLAAFEAFPDTVN
ncbi:MAG: lytic transglycosylase domain-containing protein [Desulfobacterales bacterium]|nr:MAG: lytic transglycosylase domain-containing protein [Desulfobacterales bacterium]